LPHAQYRENGYAWLPADIWVAGSVAGYLFSSEKDPVLPVLPVLVPVLC
jgi:hypothetical protein